jgi:hypothetical protein
VHRSIRDNVDLDVSEQLSSRDRRLSTLILLNAIEGGGRPCGLVVIRRPSGTVPKAGPILYDKDPRYRGRKLEVVRVQGSYATCMCGPRQVKVRLDYIFSDGQPGRSGYSTVAEE